MLDLEYKTFYIKDSKIEDIDCIFYDFISYMEQVFSQSKTNKVLIHCVHGVSRSVTLTIAYLMFVFQINFRSCFNYVKEKRGVASPNIGFVSQLLSFEQRIIHSTKVQFMKNSHDHLESYFKKSNHNQNCLKNNNKICLELPKSEIIDKNRSEDEFEFIKDVFVLRSHQREDPNYLVFKRIESAKLYQRSWEKFLAESFPELQGCRQMSERKVSGLISWSLDPRTVFIFIVNSPTLEKMAYIWKGKSLLSILLK